MEASVFRIVVVGHVDHGKSTLIGRLLHDSGCLPDGRIEEIRRGPGASDPEWAFLMDHLQEEREQERTIESAQAFFATRKRAYRIIDAPGHKEFLRNMVTGASQADGAILVVDVEAGVCEQTRRHAALLSMLGVEQLVVAINKMDRVAGRCEAFEAAAGAVGALLSEISLAARHVIPISAMKGWSLAARAEPLVWHDGPTLFEALDALEPRRGRSSQPLRLPVQDVYEINGRRVIVGRVESGQIAQGQRVICLPRGESASVASIEKFLETRTSAESGESIGLTVAEPVEMRRGVVLCDAESAATVARRFEANVFWLGDEGWSQGDALILRCATQQSGCRIESVLQRIDSSTLEVLEVGATRLDATEAARAVVALDQPIVAEPFRGDAPLGRFVLLKNGVVSAGGTVVRLLEA